MQPLAIVEQQRVCRVNEIAHGRGITPGMTTATAHALCEGLQVRARQRRQEGALLSRLAQGTLAFTPHACIDEPDADAPTLLLEIGGCLRLFHGLAALLARIDTHFSEQEVTTQRALGLTPGAARLFATNRIDTRIFFDDDGTPDDTRLTHALANLPLTGLALDPRTEKSLMQMGFTQFADINALPRQTLGRRFGHPFTLWLDRVTGTTPDPRQPVQPETFYVRDLNFLDGIVHTEGLAFPMQRLLGDFSLFLRQRQLSTQHLVWRLTHVDRTSQEIAINTTRPEVSPARLLDLTRTRLDTLRLPAPVETLRLACRRFVPLANAAMHGSLFPELHADNARDEGMAALLDRLRARLGDAHCRQLTPTDNWLPAASHIQRHSPRRRPLWLLREPARIEKNGAQFRWHGTLELLDGPERLDTDWWSSPVHRDYFIARHLHCDGTSPVHAANDSGALYWVFHDLVQDAWYVHGVFG